LTPEEAKELLRKFRSGHCTDRELEIIDRWYEAMGEENEIPLFNQNIDLNEIRNYIKDEVNKEIALEEGGTEKGKVIQFNFIIKAAAVLLIVFAVAFIFYRNNKNLTNAGPQLSSTQIIDKKLTESKEILLSDGSKVWLKEGSKLEYPEKFTGKLREVKLIGEAFFEVKRDVKRPFIIYSGNIKTKVLGTSFNIKAYDQDNSSEVAVVTGKVSVSINENGTSKPKEVILKPNQKATFVKEFNKLVRLEEHNAGKYKMVAKNEMIFNESSMKDILNTISLAYNVEIQPENAKIENCIITADLTDQSLESTLKILTRSIGAKYVFADNKILISGKGCEGN